MSFLFWKGLWQFVYCCGAWIEWEEKLLKYFLSHYEWKVANGVSFSGALFDEQSGSEEAAFARGIELVNDDRTILSRSIVDMDVARHAYKRCLTRLPAIVSSYYSLGLGLENESPQIELFQSEPSSSHNIMTFYSSIGHRMKPWFCGIGLKVYTVHRVWTLASLAILHCTFKPLPQNMGTIVGVATLLNAIFIPIASRFRLEEHEIMISPIQFLPLVTTRHFNTASAAVNNEWCKVGMTI